jgi:hypothetical protein
MDQFGGPSFYPAFSTRSGTVPPTLHSSLLLRNLADFYRTPAHRDGMNELSPELLRYIYLDDPRIDIAAPSHSLSHTIPDTLHTSSKYTLTQNMPRFLCVCRDHDNYLEKRLAVRPEHLERAKKDDFMRESLKRSLLWTHSPQRGNSSTRR